MPATRSGAFVDWAEALDRESPEPRTAATSRRVRRMDRLSRCGSLSRPYACSTIGRCELAFRAVGLAPEDEGAEAGGGHDVDRAISVEVFREDIGAEARAVVDQFGNELGAPPGALRLRTVRYQYRT